MTIPPQTPPGYPPTPPVPFAYVIKPPRPTAVTVIAICGIVWASISLLSSFFGAVMLFVSAGMANPVMDAMRRNRALFAYSVVGTVVGVGVAAMLLAGSIGALSLRPWARRMLVAWSMIAVVVAVIAQVLNWVWVQPIIEEAQRQQNLPPGVLLAGRVMGICGAVVIGVAGPMIVLYFMTRPNVKAAFEANPHASEPPAP